MAKNAQDEKTTTDRSAKVGVNQKQSFDEAEALLSAAQVMQLLHNKDTDKAIEVLQSNLADMKQQLDEMCKLFSQGQGSPNIIQDDLLVDERPSKTTKTTVGKGQGKMRASSAEPSSSSQDEPLNFQGGNAKVAHIIVVGEGSYITSRLHRATLAFISLHTPQLSGDRGVESVKARPRNCRITFTSASACGIFVNHVAGTEEPHMVLEEGEIQKIVKVKVKHDEPAGSRRRKFVTGKAYEALIEVHKA